MLPTTLQMDTVTANINAQLASATANANIDDRSTDEFTILSDLKLSMAWIKYTLK